MQVPRQVLGGLKSFGVLFKQGDGHLDNNLQQSSGTGNPPLSDIASSNTIPENILAFRTITSLLSQLPRTNPLQPIDNLKDQIWDPSQRQEIKISDAFAHLAVAQHDVAALVTSRGSHDGMLHLLTCTQDPPVEELQPISKPTESGSLIEKIWHLMFTRNPLGDDIETFSETPHPSIILPTEPEDLGGRTVFEYMLGLEKCWIQPSLRTHLWILSKVLVKSYQESNFSQHLTRYIAALCYKKMARRFNNKDLSIPYIESLKQVKLIPLISDASSIADDSGCDGNEVASDRFFLEDFVKLYAGNPELLKSRVPKIIQMAENMPPTNIDIQLYTNETRTEFHHLLLELLDCFNKALDQLIALDKTSKGSAPAIKNFNDNVDDVHLYGYALLRLSRGRAFRKHLENIESFLDHPHRSNTGVSDPELEAISRLALVNSYIAWLRLMVGHFDAVEIIVRHVTSKDFPYDTIIVEILLAPPTNKTLLPWQELFTDYKFLRKSDAANSTVTKEEIFKFLQDGMAAALKKKDVLHDLQSALRIWSLGEADSRKASHFLDHLMKLTDQEKDEIAAVKKKISDWKHHVPSNSPDSRDDITNEIKALLDVFGELSDRDRFFLYLKNMSFTGTLHCEACLASLLPAFTNDIVKGHSGYKDIKVLSHMQIYGRVIGVSKRCCPPCASFLKALMRDRHGDFSVRGSHGTISACPLPPWTPSDIVERMNDRFGEMLIQDLGTLMDKSMDRSRFRNRSRTTGSERLSLDSSEGSSGGFLRQFFPERTR